MDMFDFAGMLFGNSRASADATTVTATGAGASEDGEVGITLDADVTPAEDTGVEGDADQTIIDLPTSPDVDEGDELIVTLVGDGPLKTPVVTANPGSGDRMRALANSAKTVADAAQAVADAVNQHFFADTNGIHVTEAAQEDWNESHTGANVLINSIGQLFRDGLNNLLAIVTNGIAIYDGNGNEDGNILAKFYTFVRNENQHARVDFFNGKGFIDYDSELNTLCISARDDSTATNLMNTARMNLYQSTDNKTSNLEILAGAKGAAPPAFIQLDSSFDDGPESDPTVGPSYESTIYAYASDLLLGYYGSDGSTTIPMQQVIVALRSPVASYTGASGTATASASGWRLTHFNSLIASVGSPTTYDYTFTNGVLTAMRDCKLEISGVMNWTDSVAGVRGFGIFINATNVGSGTERSTFQNFPNTVVNRKSVTFPPRIVSLAAGSSITFGRYEQSGAVYQNGINYSWVTIRVVG